MKTCLRWVAVVMALTWGGSVGASAWSVWGEVPGDGFTSSGPAIVSDGINDYVLVRGTDDGIYLNTRTDAGWSGWTSLGGSTLSGPAMVLDGATVRAFVRGTDNRIYLNSKNDSSWSGWSEIPGDGFTSSGPAAVYDGMDIYVLVRGTDNGIYLNVKKNAKSWSEVDGWIGWTPLGGSTLSGPALVLDGSTVRAFVRGTDSHIYWNSKIGSSWTGWTGWTEVPGGGTTPDSPAAVYDGSNLHLFVQGTDNKIYFTTKTGASWSGWAPLGAETISGPGAVHDEGKMKLVVRGPDNRIYMSTYSPPVCGNDKIEAGEQCDNGYDNGSTGSTCTSLCTLKISAPNDPYSYNPPKETPPVCGNYKIEAGEQCDDGWSSIYGNGSAWSTCTSLCTLKISAPNDPYSYNPPKDPYTP